MKSGSTPTADTKEDVFSRLSRTGTKSQPAAVNDTENVPRSTSASKFISRIPTLVSHRKLPSSTFTASKTDTTKQVPATPATLKPRMPMQTPSSSIRTSKLNPSFVVQERRSSTSSADSRSTSETSARSGKFKKHKIQQLHGPFARLDEQIAQTLQHLMMAPRVSQNHSHVLSPFSALSLSNPKVSKRALFWIAQAIAVGADLLSFFKEYLPPNVLSTVPRHENSMTLALDILLEGSDVLRRTRKRSASASSPSAPRTPSSMRFAPKTVQPSQLEEDEEMQLEMETAQRRLLDEAIGMLAPLINNNKSVPTSEESVTAGNEEKCNAKESGVTKDTPPPLFMEEDGTLEQLQQDAEHFVCTSSLSSNTSPALPPLVQGSTTMLLSPLLPPTTPATRIRLGSEELRGGSGESTDTIQTRKGKAPTVAEGEDMPAVSGTLQVKQMDVEEHAVPAVNHLSVDDSNSKPVVEAVDSSVSSISISMPLESALQTESDGLLSPSTSAVLEKYKPEEKGAFPFPVPTILNRSSLNTAPTNTHGNKPIAQGTDPSYSSKYKVFSVFSVPASPPKSLTNAPFTAATPFDASKFALSTPKSVRYAHMTPPPSLSTSMIQGHIYGDSAFKTGKGLNLTNVSLSPLQSSRKTRTVLPFDAHNESRESVFQSANTSQIVQNYEETRAYLASRRLNLDNTPPSSPGHMSTKEGMEGSGSVAEHTRGAGVAMHEDVPEVRVLGHTAVLSNDASVPHPTTAQPELQRQLSLPPTPEAVSSMHLPSTLSYSAIRPRRPCPSVSGTKTWSPMRNAKECMENKGGQEGEDQERTSVSSETASLHENVFLQGQGPGACEDTSEAVQTLPEEMLDDNADETAESSGSCNFNTHTSSTLRPALQTSFACPTTPPNSFESTYGRCDSTPPNASALRSQTKESTTTSDLHTSASLDQSLGSVVVFEALPLRPKASTELGSPQILSPVRRASRLYRRSLLNELGPLSPTLQPPSLTSPSERESWNEHEVGYSNGVYNATSELMSSPTPTASASASTSLSQRRQSRHKARTPKPALPGVPVPHHVTFGHSEQDDEEDTMKGLAQRLFLEAYEDTSSLSLESEIRVEETEDLAAEKPLTVGQKRLLAASEEVRKKKLAEGSALQDASHAMDAKMEHETSVSFNNTSTTSISSTLRAKKPMTASLPFTNAALRDSMKEILQTFQATHKPLLCKFPLTHPIHKLMTLSVVTGHEPVLYPLHELPVHLLPEAFRPEDSMFEESHREDMEGIMAGRKRSRLGGSVRDSSVEYETMELSKNAIEETAVENRIRSCPFVDYGRSLAEEFNLQTSETESLPETDLQSLGLFAAYASATIAGEFFAGVSLHLQASLAPLPSLSLEDTGFAFVLNPALPEHAFAPSSLKVEEKGMEEGKTLTQGTPSKRLRW